MERPRSVRATIRRFTWPRCELEDLAIWGRYPGVEETWSRGVCSGDFLTWSSRWLALIRSPGAGLPGLLSAPHLHRRHQLHKRHRELVTSPFLFPFTQDLTKWMIYGMNTGVTQWGTGVTRGYSELQRWVQSTSQGKSTEEWVRLVSGDYAYSFGVFWFGHGGLDNSTSRNYDSYGMGPWSAQFILKLLSYSQFALSVPDICSIAPIKYEKKKFIFTK